MDEECVDLICPQGWTWDKYSDKCFLKEGFIKITSTKTVLLVQFKGSNAVKMITISVGRQYTPDVIPGKTAQRQWTALVRKRQVPFYF